MNQVSAPLSEETLLQLLVSGEIRASLHPIVSRVATKPLALGYYQLAILAAILSLIESVHSKVKRNGLIIPGCSKVYTLESDDLTQVSTKLFNGLHVVRSLLKATEIPLVLARGKDFSLSQAWECLVFTSVLF